MNSDRADERYNGICRTRAQFHRHERANSRGGIRGDAADARSDRANVTVATPLANATIDYMPTMTVQWCDPDEGSRRTLCRS